jgi:hypothetical protein
VPSFKLDEFYVRLYHGDPHDEAIADHLRQFDQSPKGIKHNEAKRLMYLGLQASDHREALGHDAAHQIARDAARQAMAASSPRLDHAAIRQAVQDAIQEAEHDFDLSDIRRVVEAALNQHLDRLQLAEPSDAGIEKAEADTDEAARIEEGLERLGKSLQH